MRSRRADRPYEQGRRDGFRKGWLRGWRLGACTAIAAHAAPQTPARRPLSVLYVPQGFEAIDHGIMDGLERNVERVHVAEAARMREAAEQLRPDAVLVLNGLHAFPADHLEQVDAIRAMGVPAAIWFVDDPYATDDTVRIAPRYSCVFTHERTCVPLYLSNGCAHVYHLPLAAHGGLFRPMDVGAEYETDVCFIGAAFWNRVRLFDEIAPYLQDKKVLIAGALWDRMRNYELVKRFVRPGWIEVPETARYYNGAKIVINLHRTTEAWSDNKNGIGWPAQSVNPRTFEMAACGTLQLTDLRGELSEHYRIGSEIETFRSPEELVAKIEYYLNREEERLQVAARSYLRTYRDHTYADRVGRLLDVLQAGGFLG